MPGAPHDILVAAFHEQPSLLEAALERLTHTRTRGRLRVADSVRRIVREVEVRPDNVFEGGDPPWTVVEVQNEIDPEKPRRWTVLVGAMFDAYGALGDVVVFTATRAVAGWAKTAVRFRTRRGTLLVIEPVVIYLDEDTARSLLDPRRPALALLAAWAMHERHGPRAQKIVVRALDLTERLPRRLRDSQRSAILAAMNDAMLGHLKKWAAHPELLPMRPAVRQFLRDMEAIGEAKGEARGKAEGKQDALLTLLAARGLAVTAANRARIKACDKTATLDRWIARAATAPSVTAVLGAARRRAPTAGARKKAVARR
jgi:hypothetical protein